jgi:hypothetical protein
MSHIGVDGTIVLCDGIEGLYIGGEEDAPAAGFTVSGGIEGEDLVSFFQQGIYISLKIAGRRFEAMGDQYLFQRGRGGRGQPAMAANGMSFEPEGKRLSFIKYRGLFFGGSYLRGTKEAKGF